MEEWVFLLWVGGLGNGQRCAPLHSSLFHSLDVVDVQKMKSFNKSLILSLLVASFVFIKANLMR